MNSGLVSVFAVSKWNLASCSLFISVYLFFRYILNETYKDTSTTAATNVPPNVFCIVKFSEPAGRGGISSIVDCGISCALNCVVLADDC